MPVKMKVGALLHTFLSLSTVPLNQPPLPRGLFNALGHTVVMTPQALVRMPSPDLSRIVVEYGDTVDEEITGAIIAGEGGVLQEQVALLNSQSGWLSRAVIVVLTDTPSQKMFRYLWWRRMSNVICVGGTGAMHAYNPFKDTVFTLNGNEDIKGILDKRWENLYGYTVSVTIYKYSLSYIPEMGLALGSGIDGSAAYELSKLYNMSIVIRDTGRNDHLFEKTNKMLCTGQVDISLNGRFLNRGVKYEKNLEYSAAVYGDSVVMVLKMPPILRGWDIFARIFKWSVWLVLLVTIIVMNRAMLWMAETKNWANSFNMTVRAIFNIPITRLPTSMFQRFILAQSFIVGMVILSIIQGLLFHFIKEGTTYAKYKTLSQVYVNRKLLTNSFIVKDFIPFSERGVEKLRDSVKILRPIKDEYFEEYALAIRQKEICLKMETGTIKENLYFVEEKLMSFSMSYAVKRGSPFLKPLSRFTTHAFEAGLSEIWYKMTIEELAKSKKTINESRPVKVLKIRDVEVAFLALGFGYILSCVMFLLEVLSKWLSGRKVRRYKRSIRKILNLLYPH